MSLYCVSYLHYRVPSATKMETKQTEEDLWKPYESDATMPSIVSTISNTPISDLSQFGFIVPYHINKQGKIKPPHRLIVLWKRIYSYLQIQNPRQANATRCLCRLLRDVIPPPPSYIVYPHPKYSNLRLLLDSLNSINKKKNSIQQQALNCTLSDKTEGTVIKSTKNAIPKEIWLDQGEYSLPTLTDNDIFVGKSIQCRYTDFKPYPATITKIQRVASLKNKSVAYVYDIAFEDGDVLFERPITDLSNVLDIDIPIVLRGQGIGKTRLLCGIVVHGDDALHKLSDPSRRTFEMCDLSLSNPIGAGLCSYEYGLNIYAHDVEIAHNNGSGINIQNRNTSKNAPVRNDRNAWNGCTYYKNDITHLVIENSTIHHNNDCGIYLYTTNATVTDCEVSYNTRSGLCCQQSYGRIGSKMNVLNSSIHHNVHCIHGKLVKPLHGKYGKKLVWYGIKAYGTADCICFDFKPNSSRNINDYVYNNWPPETTVTKTESCTTESEKEERTKELSHTTESKESKVQSNLGGSGRFIIAGRSFKCSSTIDKQQTERYVIIDNGICSIDFDKRTDSYICTSAVVPKNLRKMSSWGKRYIGPVVYRGVLQFLDTRYQAHAIKNDTRDWCKRYSLPQTSCSQCEYTFNDEAALVCELCNNALTDLVVEKYAELGIVVPAFDQVVGIKSGAESGAESGAVSTTCDVVEVLESLWTHCSTGLSTEFKDLVSDGVGAKIVLNEWEYGICHSIEGTRVIHGTKCGMKEPMHLFWEVSTGERITGFPGERLMPVDGVTPRKLWGEK